MANVWAIKSGDWSDTTVWNTGALPTSADDVYANNFNVNVNQNITVNSLRNTVNTGLTAGGKFTFNTGGVTANINNNIFMNSTSVSFIFITASSGIVILSLLNSIVYNANQSGANLFNYSGNCNLTIYAIKLINGSGNTSTILSKTSVGILTINAEIIGGNNVNTGPNTGTILLNSNSNNYINGMVRGGSSNLGSKAITCLQGDLDINGDVYGGTGGLSGVGTIVFSSNLNLNIIGNVYGDISRAITTTSGYINITGNIIGSNNNGVPTVEISGTSSLNHVGFAQASAFASAIKCDTPTTSIVTCTGPFIKNGYIVAIASQTLRINFGSNSFFQFKKSNGEDIDYVSTVEGYNYPLVSDVRYGVNYKGGLLTGSCHVPTPDNVRKNIPVDNTVGTSDNVNAEDILQAIQDSSLPIAERLRNVATVESTGAQLEAYQ